MKRRWALLLAVLWVGALLVADGWFLVEFRVVDAHLKRGLEELFSAPVSFGELSISPVGDLVATDIRMMRPDNPEKLYGTIDEIRISPSWIELFTRFRLSVKDIAIRHPTLVVKWHEKDRTFDMPSPLRRDLESKTKELGELPAIALHGLTLALDNPPDIVKKKQSFSFDQLSLTLAPEGSKRWLYRFDVELDHPILGRMRGFGRFSRDEVNVELQRNGLMVTPELLGVLIPEVRSALENVSVEGDLRLTARVGRVAGAGAAEAFSASLDCQGLAVHVAGWPQALNRIHGRLEYSQGRLSTEALTAEFDKAPLTMKGVVDLSGKVVVEASGEIVGLGITNGLASRIRKLPDPCPTVAEQIEAWDPDGYANVKFTLLQERNAKDEIGPLHPSFEVEFKGATVLRYVGHVGKDGKRHGFAYPLQDLRGVIKFTDEVASFDRLVASNGSLSVEARGRINYEKGGDETYDVDVTARGLRLDERVGAALQGSSRDLFNSLDADGSADLAVAVKRQKGEPPGPRVDITVDLQGVGIRSRAFPLDLADTRGRLVITDAGPILIDKLTAKRRGGTLGVRGTIPVDRGAGSLEMDFDFEKFPIDPNLTTALKEVAPYAAESLAKLNPTGRIDGTVHLALEPGGAQKDLRGAIRFDEMTLAPEDPSIRIDDLSGALTLSPAAVNISQGTTGSVAGERFAIEGSIKPGGGLDLRVEAVNFQIDRELLADVEPLVPSLSRFRFRPELTGPMSMKLHVVGTAENPNFSLEADFHGVDAVVGLELDGIRGHVSVSLLGEVRVTGLTMAVPVPDAPAGTDPGAPGGPVRPRQIVAFELAEAAWDPPAKTAPKLPRGRLVLTGCSARGLEINSQTIALLPLDPETKVRLENLSLAGGFDVNVGTLTWDFAELAIRKSRLAAARVTIGAERPVRAEALRISNLSVTGGGGLLDLRGEFVLEGGRFFDIPVPRCSGRLRADIAGVRFESIDGDILGYDPRQTQQKVPLGKINPETSRFEAFFAEGGFDTHVALQEVNLPAAVRALGGKPEKITGTMRANVDLRGAFGDAGSLKGSGDLSLRAWNVVSLPVFYKMFNSLDVLSVFDQRKDPWTKIDAEFLVGDRVLRMPKVRIDSPDLLLQGSGSLTFAGMAKADLKTNQGMGLSPIGWVTRIISHAVFAGVRIEGPIGDPRVEAYGMTGN